MLRRLTHIPQSLSALCVSLAQAAASRRSHHAGVLRRELVAVLAVTPRTPSQSRISFNNGRAIPIFLRTDGLQMRGIDTGMHAAQMVDVESRINFPERDGVDGTLGRGEGAFAVDVGDVHMAVSRRIFGAEPNPTRAKVRSVLRYGAALINVRPESFGKGSRFGAFHASSVSGGDA